MALQKVKELSGFDVYQKIYEKTYLTEYLSWNSNYLDKDITNTKFSNSENEEIKMDINFRNKDYNFLIKFINGNIFFDCLCNELLTLANELKCKTSELHDFLFSFSNKINLINETHKDEVEIELEEDSSEGELSTYYYESDDNFDAFDEFKEQDKSFNLVRFLSKLKTVANKKYEEIKFSPGKLNIKPNFIINVITKEIETIYKKYETIELNPIDDDIFNIDIKFKYFENEELMKSLALQDIDGIIMNVKLNHNLYPYYPPKVSFKTLIDDKLDVAIINLKYFNTDSWNPTSTLENMILGIRKILSENCTISNKSQSYSEATSIIQNLMSLNSILPNCLKSFNIDIDFVELSKNMESTQDSKHWASGVGYGFNGRSEWDINKFIEIKNIKLEENKDLLIKLLISMKNEENNSAFKRYILNSDIIDIFMTFFNQLNLVELDNNYSLYNTLLDILEFIDYQNWEQIPYTDISNIERSLKNFYVEAGMFLRLNKNTVVDYKITTIKRIVEYYKKIHFEDFNKTHQTNDNLEKYCDTLKQYQFVDVSGFNIQKYKSESFNPSKSCTLKITKELSTYQNSLPLNESSSIFVRYDENNIQLLQVLIIGPQGTPYENGCFIFDIYIPNSYPDVPPKVNLQTTGYGKVRFNPNLYNCGKVCLSLLGTWSGSQQEKWNRETSTLLQVLVSIQSLIFVDDPYYNEPGYERDMNTEKGKLRSFDYNEKIRKATIDWAINDMIENNTSCFSDVIDNHFKFKKNEISETVRNWYNESKKNKDELNETVNKMSSLFNKI